MASLGMDGPYDFSPQVVENTVKRTQAGNFALGTIDSDGAFVVNYVGRSDSDVKTELKSKPTGATHQKFKFKYANSPKEAYEKECWNFHDFRPTENIIHPAKPNGTLFPCPMCGQ